MLVCMMKQVRTGEINSYKLVALIVILIRFVAPMRILLATFVVLQITRALSRTKYVPLKYVSNFYHTIQLNPPGM